VTELRTKSDSRDGGKRFLFQLTTTHQVNYNFNGLSKVLSLGGPNLINRLIIRRISEAGKSGSAANHVPEVLLASC